MLDNFISRNLSWGKKISMKGAQDFLAFKKNGKINMKKLFQLEVKSSSKNSKRTEIIMHMKGSPPPNISLFTLKYF